MPLPLRNMKLKKDAEAIWSNNCIIKQAPLREAAFIMNEPMSL